MMLGEVVTVLTAQTRTDRYGQDVPDWSQPLASAVDVPDVLCEPRPSGEPLQDARNQVTSGFTLYMQTVPAVPPTAANRIRVRGVDYDVEGDPADWRLGAWRPGLVVQTTLTKG